jgi:hypothetical protein
MTAAAAITFAIRFDTSVTFHSSLLHRAFAVSLGPTSSSSTIAFGFEKSAPVATR